MRLLLAWALAAGGAALLLVTTLVRKAAEVAIEEEYETWAPKVARVLARMAGFVCRARRDRWWADLCFMQQVERKTGLVEAWLCFISCWHLAVRDAIHKAVVDLSRVCVAISVVRRQRFHREAEHVLASLNETTDGITALEGEFKALDAEIRAITKDAQRLADVSDSSIRTRHQEEVERLAAFLRQHHQSYDSLESRKAVLLDRMQRLLTQAGTLRKRAERKLTRSR